MLCVSGLLIAVGIIIPMYSPLKLILEPASFTLASHVAIIVAMFISPAMAASVAIGTTIGFYLGAYPIVIVLRAATHVIFATAGAAYLLSEKRKAKLCSSFFSLRIYSFLVALAHSLCELVVVSVFYFYGSMGPKYYEHGFFTSVLLLVGLGTIVHSMVDFELAHVVILALRKMQGFKAIIR